MKKLSIFLAAAAVIGLASCSTEHDPVYNAPAEGEPAFILNTPTWANQYMELTDGDTFEVTAYQQPDYGYSAIVNYNQLQVALAEADFANPEKVRTLTATADHDPTSRTQVYKQSDLAVALCELHGFTSADNYIDLPAQEIFIRGIASLNEVESSVCYSQPVALKQVKFYYAVPTAGFIYVVGLNGEWTEPTPAALDIYKDYRLYESADAIGSKIYSGVFDLPAGTVGFRLFKDLTGWGNKDNQMGAGPDDMTDINIDADFVDGVYNGPITQPGQSNWSFTWTGGEVTFIVDLNTMQITISSGSVTPVIPQYIYIVGSPQGWDVASDAIKLTDSDESGIYKGTFPADAGDVYFRIYTELGDWGNDGSLPSIGPNPTDGDNLAISLPFSGTAVAGKGSWEIDGWAGGDIHVEFDMNTYAISISAE